MSDRYQFLKDYQDPQNPAKTFKSGSTARMSDGDGAALMASGTVKQVADFTPQRKNVLAPGGCTELSEAQKAEITPPDTSEAQTAINTKNKK
jgi:hypothetical protein